MWVDTHAHFPADAGSIREWVQKARQSGVKAILAVGGSSELNRSARLAARLFPGYVSCALGWDRDQAGQTPDHLPSPADGVQDGDQETPPIATGEIGLDYHYSPDTTGPQKQLLVDQLVASYRQAKPVIVHSRQAERDTIAAMDEAAGQVAPPASGAGVVHCFTGDWNFARQLLDRNFFVSFSGIVTFRNAGALRTVAARIPENRLLVETDAPFLSPVPLRGRRNEPSFLPFVGRFLAELRSVSGERLADITSANATCLFGWP